MHYCDFDIPNINSTFLHSEYEHMQAVDTDLNINNCSKPLSTQLSIHIRAQTSFIKKIKKIPSTHTWGGSKYETHKNLTNKFNTHFTKTHYNQTLKHNERGSNVHFFFYPLSDGRCNAVIFLKRNENILQLTADDVNFLSKENMQMKCVNTIK